MNFTKLISKGANIVKECSVKNAPVLLTGMAIGFGVTSIVLAVKATPKALELINDADENKKESGNGDEILTVKEKIEVAWKPFVPAVITGTLAITCSILACKEGYRRSAALVAAYKLSETALTDYKNAVIKTVGEDKEEEIRDEVARNHIRENPPSKSNIIITEKGNTLCYDVISGRYFKSDIDTIKRIQTDLNYRLFNEMYISLNEFYYELGLDCIKLGNDLGWNVNNGKIDVSFSAHITEDNQPCVVIDYNYCPRYNYQDLL